jgi:adenosylcobalamin-dependent ribonucleoside-triphosphate reductase
MVSELNLTSRKVVDFPASAPAAYPVFFRTYSRFLNGGRENWQQVCTRTLRGLVKLGNLDAEEAAIIDRMQRQVKALPSGRWLWVGGSEWLERPENFSGAYNCTSTNVIDWRAFGLMMDLAMMGCGTGAILEPELIDQLPAVRNLLEIGEVSSIGTTPAEQRRHLTDVEVEGNHVTIHVGDSRQGWVKSYQTVLELCSDERFSGTVKIDVDLADVRPAGELLKGFGGMANPVKLPELYARCVRILNKAHGRKLNSVECCLLIDEAAVTIVAGNIRRSAGMRQFNSTDTLGANAKDNLWQQSEDGSWKIDPERDSLRMANHTRVFHRKPTLEECVDAVRKQYYSGEGAIQWAGEAVARSNADVISPDQKRDFLAAYSAGKSVEWLVANVPSLTTDEAEKKIWRYGLNPCGEIIGADFHCNLSEVHLNQLNPNNLQEQEDAFRASALSVAALLNHQFQEPRYQYSRLQDPIVGVSFTGLFDFFVHAFGTPWLEWWATGRPATEAGKDFKAKEAEYLTRWATIVHEQVWAYCDKHGIKRPNRCTTTQPAGCLDRTALRIFDQGLLYADEVVEAGSGESRGLDLSVRNGIAVDTAIANQPLNLVRVTLESGRILRMTPNHRFSIANQWVRADQLQLGMEIDYSLGEYQQQEDALLLGLNTFNYSREGRKELLGHGRGVLTTNITTPISLNPELGYFLGCMFGDGAMSESKNRVRFAFNEQEWDLVERLQTIAQNQFGLTGNVSHDPRNGGTRGELSFASGQLFDWLNLNQLGKIHSADLDRIPLAIRKSSRETILAFFCGLIDTDGCVRKKGDLSIDSSSEIFIRNLQQVGEAVGLCFSIFHNSQGENFQGQKNMWGLSLSRMLSQPDTLTYLNTHSRKCKLRPLPEPKRYFAFRPYQITNVEFETSPDYSYDFAVAGVSDDDSWYWQGALKSHNTKSLLTGASPGWHPPKAQRFIRRITFRKNDPVALACIEYGYSAIPSQSDKDENGNLLNDPFDPRCTEWLIEIPVAVSWADIPGADQIEISKFDAMSQMDFYMQVQSCYTAHNTSATIELREAEIEPLGQKIFEAIRDDEGYISAALLARFDDLQTFPRLPFEPIDKATYDQLMLGVQKRQMMSDFAAALAKYDSSSIEEAGPAGCDSDKCLLPDKK